ncbi:MAG: hypothetical protein ACR2PS_01665, partial [Pseudomonadales bacterium]
MKISATLLVIVAFGLFSGSVYSKTIDVRGCERSAVQEAIISASDGDTVLVVGAGDDVCDWRSAIEIDKSITVKGNGIYDINDIDEPKPGPDDPEIWKDTGTWPFTIKLFGNSAFVIATPRGGFIRVSGFKFIGESPPGRASGAIDVKANEMSDAFRIDNCFFGMDAWQLSIFSGKGLVDHCYFDGENTGGEIDILIQEGLNAGDTGRFSNCDWAPTQPIGFGKSDFVFVENSTFYRDGMISSSAAATDITCGGKAVLRNCNFRNSPISTHGDDTGGIFTRGVYAVESYNNKFYVSVAGGGGGYHSLRGGSWIAHNNLFFDKSAGYGTKAYNPWIKRLDHRTPEFEGCEDIDRGCCDDGTYSGDATTGGNNPPGRRCLGQTGTGMSTERFEDMDGFAQEHQISYIWNTTHIPVDDPRVG